MITFLPQLYPDELIYSLLARYYIKTGYLAYIFAAQDLFTNPKDNPNIEFVNKLNDVLMHLITANISFKDIILKHTMFPYYSKFLPYERRTKAYQSLFNMDSNYCNLLPLPKSKNNTVRYLRYCPLCVIKDREDYGETYWHRIHQMIGVNICTIHNCYLKDSNIPIMRKASPMLVTAEEVSITQTLNYCTNNIEIEISQYIVSVFQSEFIFTNQTNIGKFLHSQMDNTVYKSVRGEQRNITLLHKDFSEYYRCLPNNWFTEVWQIQKILTNSKTNFYEVCLLANFLHISPNELNEMAIPKRTQQELFDEQIFLLHEQGFNYPEIAKKLNASINVVKCIGEKRYGTYHKQSKHAPMKCGVKTNNWIQIDKDTLPLVKKAILELQSDINKRPKKVTIYAIEKMLKLPQKRIDNMPLCKSEILKHYETQSQYWAREIIWAINQIITNNQPLNWKHIRQLINIRKTNLISCLPYLKQYKEYKWEYNGRIIDLTEIIKLII